MNCVILENGKAILCLTCEQKSYHPDDVKNLYCGHCNIFHTNTGIIDERFANLFDTGAPSNDGIPTGDIFDKVAGMNDQQCYYTALTAEIQWVLNNKARDKMPAHWTFGQRVERRVQPLRSLLFRMAEQERIPLLEATEATIKRALEVGPVPNTQATALTLFQLKLLRYLEMEHPVVVKAPPPRRAP